MKIEFENENRQNCEWCKISNGGTIPKFTNFWNFGSFSQWKKSENLLIFLFEKLWKFVDFTIWKIPKISNLENLK